MLHKYKPKSLKKMLYTWIPLLAIWITMHILLTGNIERKDISDLPQYAGVVGKKYSTKRTFYVKGVARYGEKTLKVYTFGWSTAGREILSMAEAKAGTTFKVKKIHACTNCFFFTRHDVEIEILGIHEYSEYPVIISGSISHSYEQSSDTLILGKDPVWLNPRYFEEIMD